MKDRPATEISVALPCRTGEIVPTSSAEALGGFLAKLEVRHPLDDADRFAFLRLPGTVKTLQRHEFILREGDMPQHCCILASGFVICHKTGGKGGRQITSMHMPGDAIDLNSSLLDRATRSAQMQSCGEVIRIPIDAIHQLAASRPSLGHAMWKETCVDAAILGEWTYNIGRRHAKSRVAHMLCEAALRLGAVPRVDGTTTYRMPMTQEELADALGLTQVHINRVLKELADEGLIRRTIRSINILDWRRLAKVGDFDPAYLHLVSNSSRLTSDRPVHVLRTA
jgi:CRP-like cAMP-binding protein